MTAQVEQTERSICFSWYEVPKALRGLKTEARRAIKPGWSRCLDLNDEEDRAKAILQCPFGKVGTKLWVKETWCQQVDPDTSRTIEDAFYYEADGIHVVKDDGDGFTVHNRDGTEASPWLSPVRMPRPAARLFLVVTGIRIESLQDMTEAGARAEGMDPSVPLFLPTGGVWPGEDPSEVGYLETSDNFALPNFQRYWNISHSKPRRDRGLTWSHNPHVWVISFKKV